MAHSKLTGKWQTVGMGASLLKLKPRSMASSTRVQLAVCILAALLSTPGLSAPSFISMPAGGLAVDLHANSCPQLQDVVLSTVQAAVRSEVSIAAGLLRVFFHDCFPQGCDASILLTGDGSERHLLPNLTLQPRAMQLIEDIRAKVHAACGPTVSCADITALAARDAVVVSGGPAYDVPLGRLDSLAPAPSWAVFQLPRPNSDAETLLRDFLTRNLDATDLVALSGGGHTIGKSRCSSFQDRFKEEAAFVRRLSANCTSDPNRLQELDVTTSDVFDNKYFINLKQGNGVLTSDQTLAGDSRTSWLVDGFAVNQWGFFNQFVTSMTKLGNLSGLAGEVRNSCFRRNGGGQSILATAVDEDDGSSASAST